MRTKPFQLEETVPGSFFFQGLAGGMLAGFIFVVAIACSEEQPSRYWLIPLTPVYMVMGSILGVIKATLMWGTYRVTKIQLRAPARVAIATACVGLIALAVSLKSGIADEKQFAIGVGIGLLTALPVALLVGSSVKPWELFTFGSIANSKNRNRSGSRRVLASIGTLPLRFLSIIWLGFWILDFACDRKRQIGSLNTGVVFAVPLIYLLSSAYVSFRSPGKIVLLVTGLAIIIPIGFIAFYSDTIKAEVHLDEGLLTIINSCNWFLIAWGLFLIARLAVRTRKAMPANISTDALGKTGIASEHHCLGSRFLAWQQRVTT
jgi:hypothetical protein